MAAAADGGWAAAVAELLAAEDSDAEAEAAQEGVGPSAPDAERAGGPSAEVGAAEAGAALQGLADELADPLDLVTLAAQARRVADDRLDSVTLQVIDHFLGPQESGLRSVTSLERQFGLNRKLVRQLRELGASAAAIYEERNWQRLEQRVADHPDADFRKVLYIEWSSYDGVDLWMTSRTAAHVDAALDSEAAEAEGAGFAEARPAEATSGAVAEASAPAPALTKVLHCEGGVAMIIESGGTPQVLLAPRLNTVAAMDRHTSENLVQSLAAQAATFRAAHCANAFPRRLRLTTTDKGANNYKAERSLLADRPHWAHLHLDCVVHTIAGIHKRTFDLFKEPVSGMYAFARSLRGGGYVAGFRRALATILQERLVLTTPTTLPRDAVAYKDFVLSQFIGPNSEHGARRHALCRLLPGDWREPRVEFMAEGDVRKEKVAQLMAKYLVTAMAGRAPRAWPRHRWTGFDVAVGDVGLLLAVHQLLPAVYDRWLQRQFGGKGKAAESVGGAGAEALEAEVAGQGPAGEGSGDAGQAWARMHAEFRGQAQSWLKGEALANTMMLSLVLPPLSTYMMKQVTVSSARWVDEQWGQTINRGAESLKFGEYASSRDWALGLAASGRYDDEAMQLLEQCQSKDHYANLPKSAWTVAQRCLAFRLHSRVGCSLHELCVFKHKGYPYKLWTLLDGSPDSAASVLADCPRLRDTFSADFVAAHRENLQGPFAMAELLTIASLARTNTARLESLHAFLSRMVKGTYHQVRQPDLATVAAEYTLARARVRERQLVAPGGLKALGGARAAAKRKEAMRQGFRGMARDQGKMKRKLRGGGGAWRAFLSEQLRNKPKQKITPELAAAYHALPLEEVRRLSALGKTGTDAHKAGGPAFGTKAWDAKRKAQREALRTRGEQLLAQPAPSSLSHEAVATAQLDIGLAVDGFRFDARCVRRCKRARTEKAAEAYSRWQSGPGVQVVNQALARSPTLATLAGSLYALPWPAPGAMMQWIPPFRSETSRLLAFAKGEASRSRKASETLQALARTWQHRHLLWEHHLAPALPAPEPPRRAPNRPPSCQEAGVCLCSGAGQRTWAQRQRLVAALKLAVPQPLRVQLAEGLVVLRLLSAAGEPSPAAAGEIPEGGLQHEVWVHVGLMYWSPFRPSFRELKLSKKLPGHHGRVELVGQHRYLTQYQLAQQLAELSDGWTLQAYLLLSMRTPLADFDPKIVWASPAATPAQEWSIAAPGRAPRAGSGAPSTDASGWAAEVAALAVSSDEEEVVEDEEGGCLESQSEDGLSKMSEVSSDHQSLFESESELLGELSDISDAGDSEAAEERPAPPTSSSSSSESTESAEVGSPGAALAAEPAPPAVVGEAAAGAAPADALAEAPKVAKQGADLVAVLPTGAVLRFYESLGQVVASCPLAHQHSDRCRLTRTIKGGRKVGQGRPMGLILAWCKMADQFPSHDAHVHIRNCEAAAAVKSHEERVAARVEGLGIEDLKPFFEKERPVAEGEEEEPLRVA